MHQQWGAVMDRAISSRGQEGLSSVFYWAGGVFVVMIRNQVHESWRSLLVVISYGPFWKLPRWIGEQASELSTIVITSENIILVSQRLE